MAAEAKLDWKEVGGEGWRGKEGGSLSIQAFSEELCMTSSMQCLWVPPSISVSYLQILYIPHLRPPQNYPICKAAAYPEEAGTLAFPFIVD